MFKSAGIGEMRASAVNEKSFWLKQEKQRCEKKLHVFIIYKQFHAYFYVSDAFARHLFSNVISKKSPSNSSSSNGENTNRQEVLK